MMPSAVVLVLMGFTVLNFVTVAVNLKMLTEIYKEQTIRRRYEKQ